MQQKEEEIIKETTIEELNKFLSNISYNYYDVPMAMILSYYKNNFIPLTQNNIYLDIISNKNYKEKLRKSNGEEYARIQSAIQKTICYDLIFKQIEDENNKNDPNYEPKYSIDLNGIIDYWNEQAFLMKRDYIVKCIEKKNKLKLKANKINIIEESNLKTNSNLINEIYKSNNFLKKKTRRKNLKLSHKKRISFSFNNRIKRRNYINSNNYKSNNKIDYDISANEEDFENNFKNKNLSNVKYYNFRSKDNTFNKMIKYNDEINMDEISDILNNENLSSTSSFNIYENKNNFNYENILLKIFSKSIFDVWPKLDEKDLEKIIDNYNDIIKKVNLIKNKLQDLMNIKSKYYSQIAEDEKIHSEKEKEKIFKVYDHIKQKFFNQNSVISYNEKLLRNLDYNHEIKWLKQNTNNYLLIYEETYNNLSKMVNDRIKVLEYLSKIKEELIKDIHLYEENLENFIKNSISKINKTSSFLKKYTKNYFEQSMELVINMIEDKFYNEKNRKNFENTQKIKKEIKNESEISIRINKNKNDNLDYLEKNSNNIMNLNNKGNLKYINSIEYMKKTLKDKKSNVKKYIDNPIYQSNKFSNQNSNNNLSNKASSLNNINKKQIINRYMNKKNNYYNNTLSNYNSDKNIKRTENQIIILDDYTPNEPLENIPQKHLLKEPLFINKSKDKNIEKDLKLIKEDNSNNSFKAMSGNNNSVISIGLTKIKQFIFNENNKIDYDEVMLKDIDNDFKIKNIKRKELNSLKKEDTDNFLNINYKSESKNICSNQIDKNFLLDPEFV